MVCATMGGQAHSAADAISATTAPTAGGACMRRAPSGATRTCSTTACAILDATRPSATTTTVRSKRSSNSACRRRRARCERQIPCCP
eukprot:5438118-Prymnesium_polylepis.1